MIAEYNFKQVEKKWQKKWLDSKVFEANPDKDKKKFFVNFPYSYLNGPLHIGHAFTATRVESFARYKRMNGYNVLFPWGFHATGEPVVGVAKRVKLKDEKQIKVLKDSGIPSSEIKKFEDPQNVIKYYKNRIQNDAKNVGYSVDWRRSFTTIDPQYNKFIEWQYLTLKDLGYVGKGTHPVIWCPNCKSPTGDHDRLEGEGVSPVEFTLLKFKLQDSDEYLIAATLRSETVYGQTNMWIKPDQEYVKAEVNGQTWIISEECAKKLGEQLKQVKIKGKVIGKDLIGKYCTAPGINREIIILPSKFCDPSIGTGIVTSVPSDAPYDWIALVDLQNNEAECKKYGIDSEMIKKMQVIPIIETKDWGDKPALKICEQMKIKDQNDPKLEEATAIIYKAGFHKGKLNKNCGKYAGMSVMQAKDAVKQELIDKGKADVMYETEKKVICRCTTPCIVKILKDQWFLKYSLEEWKQLARKALKQTRLYPEDARKAFENTIEWLEDKACARRSGLGTNLPWDKDWIVETLSDSTIYMSFYTISYKIYENIKPEELTKQFFDYVFLGKGEPKEQWKELREEFEYWYGFDFRNSGNELIPNHLTFCLFHHAAIWPEKYWPKAIGVNGMLMVEGEKMSKSKGNFLLLDSVVNEFGADVTRMNLMYSAEGMNEPNWQKSNAWSLKGWMGKMLQYADLCNESGSKKNKIDDWLLSKLQKHIKEGVKEYEATMFRSALQHCFFDPMNDMKWYLHRNNNKAGPGFKQAFETVLKMSNPVIPHICEESWEKLGNKELLVFEKFPKPNEKIINEKLDLGEDLIKKVADDVRNVIKLSKIEKPKSIKIFIAPDWKRTAYELAIKSKNPKQIMKEIMAKSEIKEREQEASKYATYLSKHFRELLKQILITEEEVEMLTNAVPFLKTLFNAEITVEHALDSDNSKAKQAIPMKPAIFIE